MEESAKIISVNELLNTNLSIPDYQRPYKWTIRNVEELLNDIASAISDSKTYGSEFGYRIGTIIVHQNGDCFDIVDGQQRIITLTMLKHYLDSDFHNSIMDKEFNDIISQDNIRNNGQFIREWFSLKKAEKEVFNNALEKVLEVVFIPVQEETEAFQLFDSQNTRGKELDPHDLLKA